MRKVPGPVFGCRNQPVSIAIAVNSPVEISRVNDSPQGSDGADEDGAGRLGGRVLEEDRAQVVLADMVIDHHPRPGEVADHPRHVAELTPGRKIEDHQHLAVGQVGRGNLGPQVLEQRPVRVEEIIPGRCEACVDHPDVLAPLPQKPGHSDLRAQRITVRAHVGRDEEAIVLLDQVGQRGPFHAHVGVAIQGGSRKSS